MFVMSDFDTCIVCNAPLTEGSHASCVLTLKRERDDVRRTLAELSQILDSPQTSDFLSAVANEAAHQTKRWGHNHDAGKEPQDWFWLLGWLSGKAVKAATLGDIEKALHHTISSAAVLMNWHAYLSGDRDLFRPGIDPES